MDLIRLFSFAFMIGCAPQQLPCAQSVASPATTTTSAPITHATPPPEQRHIYRFDFAFTTIDGTTTQATTFTLNLAEHDRGDIHIGKNVMLSSMASTGTTPGSPGPRQDVGLKISVTFVRLMGDDALIVVNTELSAFEAPAIRKMTASSNALATLGKVALVTHLEEDHKRYELTVTTTKLL